MAKGLRSIIALLFCVAVFVFSTTVTASAQIEGEYLYYDQLDANGKAIYDDLSKIDIYDREVETTLPEPMTAYADTVTEIPAELETQILSAVDALRYDHPEIYWLKFGAGGTSNSIGYLKNGNRITFTKVVFNIVVVDHYKNNLASVDSQLKEAVKNFPVTGDTLYEKIESIHDTLCSMITYKETDSSFDAVGALVYGEAVCEGISEAFKLICDYNNIPCVLVSGTGITSGGAGGSGPHMWNYVRMENEKWYAVDATWDLGDGVVYHEYLLVGSNTVSVFYGDSFHESHLASGDFSGWGEKEFIYPTLSASQYNPASDSFELNEDSSLYFYEDCLCGIEAGSTDEDITSQFGGTVYVVNADGEKHTGVVSTGMFIYNGTELVLISVKGDVNGDGEITSADLLLIKQIVMRTKSVAGAAVYSARTVNTDRTSSVDALYVLQKLL